MHKTGQALLNYALSQISQNLCLKSALLRFEEKDWNCGNHSFSSKFPHLDPIEEKEWSAEEKECPDLGLAD